MFISGSFQWYQASYCSLTKCFYCTYLFTVASLYPRMIVVVFIADQMPSISPLCDFPGLLGVKDQVYIYPKLNCLSMTGFEFALVWVAHNSCFTVGTEFAVPKQNKLNACSPLHWKQCVCCISQRHTDIQSSRVTNSQHKPDWPDRRGEGFFHFRVVCFTPRETTHSVSELSDPESCPFGASHLDQCSCPHCVVPFSTVPV